MRSNTRNAKAWTGSTSAAAESTDHATRNALIAMVLKRQCPRLCKFPPPYRLGAAYDNALELQVTRTIGVANMCGKIFGNSVRGQGVVCGTGPVFQRAENAQWFRKALVNPVTRLAAIVQDVPSELANLRQGLPLT